MPEPQASTSPYWIHHGSRLLLGIRSKYTLHMIDAPDPLTAERQFFTSLVEASVEGLDRVLADDFILIEVWRGSEITKPVLLAAIGSGELKFDAVEPADSHVRVYQGTAVITGRTQMTGRFGETPFTVSSRYTHVFVEQEGRWRMVSAQGTQISPQ
jgi:Domain of unknown function (DUF4440)